MLRMFSVVDVESLLVSKAVTSNVGQYALADARASALKGDPPHDVCPCM